MSDDADLNNPKWIWDKDDVEWTDDGPKTNKPLLTPEAIKIAKENLRRIQAGEPLLNGQSPHPKKGDVEVKD